MSKTVTAPRGISLKIVIAQFYLLIVHVLCYFIGKDYFSKICFGLHLILLVYCSFFLAKKKNNLYKDYLNFALVSSAMLLEMSFMTINICVIVTKSSSLLYLLLLAISIIIGCALNWIAAQKYEKKSIKVSVFNTSILHIAAIYISINRMIRESKPSIEFAVFLLSICIIFYGSMMGFRTFTAMCIYYFNTKETSYK